MIDISKLKYSVILITEKGEKLHITQLTDDLGWEEGDGELSSRISFSLRNATYHGKRISSIAKLGCTVRIYASWGGKSEEVARGKINDWTPSYSGNEKSSVDITANDELFDLEQSQDNRYIPAGTGTKTAITRIFTDWGIPLGAYNGPNVRHAKTVFKDTSIGDIITQLLNDAEKKGSDKTIIRASCGKIDVIPRGSNKDIYHFDADSNTTVVQQEISTSSLVTRVKVVGKEDKAGRTPVEAIVNGSTEYGIRQEIVNRSSDDTLATAKKEAEKIISEKGKPTHTISIEGPDVPVIRKGDKIYVKAGTLDGYYYTKSVRHDAAGRSMTMELGAA